TVLQFGNLSVKQNDPDYIPLVVANRILGGGSACRLFQNIREQKGYTYGAYSSLSASRWPGIWGASASVRKPARYSRACARPRRKRPAAGLLGHLSAENRGSYRGRCSKGGENLPGQE